MFTVRLAGTLISSSPELCMPSVHWLDSCMQKWSTITFTLAKDLRSNVLSILPPCLCCILVGLPLRVTMRSQRLTSATAGDIRMNNRTALDSRPRLETPIIPQRRRDGVLQPSVNIVFAQQVVNITTIEIETRCCEVMPRMHQLITA